MEKSLEIKRRAQRYVQSGDLDRAIEEYRKLLAASDSDPYTHVTLGDLYFKKGVLDEAGRRYMEAAEAYRTTGLIKNAIAVCKKMLRLNLRNQEVLKSLAELHAHDGLATEAALYYVQSADVLLARDLRTEAAEALGRASVLVPDEPRYPERLGEIHGLIGDGRAAAFALLDAARLYDARGEGEQAHLCRGRAEEYLPGAAEAYAEERVQNEAAGPAREAISGPGANESILGGGLGRPGGRSGEDDGVARSNRFVPPSTVSRERIESTQVMSTALAQPAPSANDTAASESVPSIGHEVPGDVAQLLLSARSLVAQGEREQAAEILLKAAQCWEAAGGLEEATSIYHELARSPQASERLYRLWLSNCERREQWKEAAAVCCELGDLALAAQEPATAHEWFVQARAYDPSGEKAQRRLERLSDWGRRTETPPAEGRVTVQRRMPEDFDVDLTELLSAFKQGVREQVQADDSTSHYDLGMTYRQMGLLDEAVAEFRLAARDPAFAVKCTDMLGRCLLERGDFGAAIAEFERGLQLPDLPSEIDLSFRYSLGLVLEASGRSVEALEQFESVFAAQPNYPDVAAKIRELRR